MEPFDIGPQGFPICVDNQYLCVTTQPSGAINVYKYGKTGRAIYVDDTGRLLVSFGGNLKYKKEDFTNQLDGVAQNFILSYSPASNTLKIYYNGLLQKSGIDNDYIIINKTVQTNFIPRPRGVLTAEYFY